MKPQVDPGADAEALFWDVRVEDEVSGGDARAVLWHHLRIKIFTERGRESQSNIDLPFAGNNKITDIAARTIKPNGDVVELKKDGVYERMLVKASGLKVKAKSFAMPAVEVGSIIEYRWKEIRMDQLTNYVALQYQRDIPVQSVAYHIKPFTNPFFPFGMRAQAFGMKFPGFVKEKDGFYAARVEKMPALKDEPRMPPEDQVRAWMLVFYSEDTKLGQKDYWNDVAKRLYNNTKPFMKVNDDVRKATREAIGDAVSDEDKFHRIFDYIRSHIKNINNESSGMTAAEREKAKDNRSPADTLKNGMGTGLDIDYLFGAMANSIGYDARIARTHTRYAPAFDPSFTDLYFFRGYVIAVKTADKWRFFDPASTYVAYGMLGWAEEGVPAIIADAKEAIVILTPVAPASASLSRREGKFTLNEEGTLEGEVQIVHTGHAGTTRKSGDEGDSAAEREESLRKSVTGRMNTAEVTNIKIENVTDPVQPVTYSYHVKVPGYAQRTGKRLFVQPAFFDIGYAAMFTASERRHPVFFRHGYVEHDSIEIQLPEGYSLDHPEAPSGVNFGAVGKFEVDLKVSKDGRRLICERKLTFADGGAVIFPASAYPALKKAFEMINTADTNALTLKYTTLISRSGGQ